jgi:hypothetical protein
MVLSAMSAMAAPYGELVGRAAMLPAAGGTELARAPRVAS